MVTDERPSRPKTLTVEQALARMRTYVEEPEEETQAEFIAAALAYIAYKDTAGRWRGVCSSPPEVVEP